MGTLAYLAPERLGGARASAASDVWSLGALACVGLTGRPPRMGGSIAELVEQRDDAPPSVSDLAPDLGTAFDASIGAALDPDARRRPSPLAFSTGLVGALGKWSRAGGAVAAGAAAAGAASAETAAAAAIASGSEATGSPLGSDATTRMLEAPPDRRTPRRTTRRGRTLFAGVAILAGLVIAGALAVGSAGGVGRILGGAPPSSLAQATAATPPSPSPSQSGSPSPPPATPSQSPTAPPSPTPTADPLAAAKADLEKVRQAISDAKGGRDGLKGREADRLSGLADQVGAALDGGDVGQAAATADALLQATQEAFQNGQGDEGQTGDRGRALLDSVTALRQAIPSD